MTSSIKYKSRGQITRMKYTGEGGYKSSSIHSKYRGYRILKARTTYRDGSMKFDIFVPVLKKHYTSLSDAKADIDKRVTKLHPKKKTGKKFAQK